MKYFNYRVLIFLIILLFGFFFIFSNYSQKKSIQNTKFETDEESYTNSNIIKDIKYSSKDLSGNEYIIFADEGEIDLNKSEVIFLKDIKAFINLIDNNEVITIVSNFGKYNTINFDTIFSNNVFF